MRCGGRRLLSAGAGWSVLGAVGAPDGVGTGLCSVTAWQQVASTAGGGLAGLVWSGQLFGTALFVLRL